MAFIQAETWSTIDNKTLPELQLRQTAPSVCLSVRISHIITACPTLEKYPKFADSI